MENEIAKIKNQINELLERLVEFTEPANKMASVCSLIHASWSGSDLNRYCNLFYGDFEKPPYNRQFSNELGLLNGVPEGWYEKSDEEVLQKIKNDVGVLPEDLDKEADLIENDFKEIRKQAKILFSNISKDAAAEIEKFNLQTKTDYYYYYYYLPPLQRDSSLEFAPRIKVIHGHYRTTALFIISATKQLNDFLDVIDKVVAQNKSTEQKIQSEDDGRIAYIDKNTLSRLSRIENGEFDLSRLISFCNELNDNYSSENYYSCAMLLRAILDHIPPIFQRTNFADVCAQHGGKSFKEIVRPLNETAKKIGDDYLHTQISKKVLATTENQVRFQANLDVLLNEIAAILEQQ